MLDDRKIKEELSKSERQYEDLYRNVEIMKRDKANAERRVRAATSDKTKAEEALSEINRTMERLANDKVRAESTVKKQKEDFERVISEQDTVVKKLKESEMRMMDYKTKIEQLNRQVREMTSNLSRGLNR